MECQISSAIVNSSTVSLASKAPWQKQSRQGHWSGKLGTVLFGESLCGGMCESHPSQQLTKAVAFSIWQPHLHRYGQNTMSAERNNANIPDLFNCRYPKTSEKKYPASTSLVFPGLTVKFFLKMGSYCCPNVRSRRLSSPL